MSNCGLLHDICLEFICICKVCLWCYLCYLVSLYIKHVFWKLYNLWFFIWPHPSQSLLFVVWIEGFILFTSVIKNIYLSSVSCNLFVSFFPLMYTLSLHYLFFVYFFLHCLEECIFCFKFYLWLSFTFQNVF